MKFTGSGHSGSIRVPPSVGGPSLAAALEPSTWAQAGAGSAWLAGLVGLRAVPTDPAGLGQS